MPESNLFTDPATDVYPTETPWGPVMAIFDTDLEKPGVRFDPPNGPAVQYMREVIGNAIGHHGIGFTLDTLSQDDYVGFCQPEGVTIEVPWYLREEGEDGKAVAFDSVTPADLGPVFTEYRNNPEGAIDRLMRERTGDARAAWVRSDLGAIDLIYGNAKTGLAKIAAKHPEMIAKLPDLLKTGKLIRKPGASKAFLVQDGSPPEVAVIALDWYGAAKTWVVTSYRDERGVFTGDLKRIDTEALDSAWVEVLYAGQGTTQSIVGAPWGVNFDDASGSHDLNMLRAQLSETSGSIARLAVARALMAARMNPAADETPATPRRPTAALYSHDDKRTKGQRQAANDAAVVLLRRVQSGDLLRENLTDADREVLAAYSGNGGALTSADGTIGSDYEYYTPSALAAGAWDLLGELGFAGGKVLDPCGGTGVFGATAPANAVVDAVELSEISGQINALVNDGPGYHTTIAPFERVAAATEDETYDAVVTNVPFSRDVDARGGNQYEDPKYQKEPMENYFILRSLEKLKPGGLAAFIVPPRCVSGTDAKQVRLRRSASLMAEFLGAYRLPNHVFGNADADTIVDLMVFRKFSRAVASKVSELLEQAPAVLAEANVMWAPFLEGKYFQGEGKRFVLGEFVPKDPTKFRDVDRVTNPASVPEVAKMLRKFGGSRIDWGALEATETAPITYRDGDTLYQAGQLLELRNGVWEPRAPTETDRSSEQLLARMATAMQAFAHQATFADGEALAAYFTDSGRTMDTPDWLRRLVRDVKTAAPEQRETLWRVGLIGFAAMEALNRHADNPRDSLAEIYPDLTAAMQRMRAEAAKLRGRFDAAKDAAATLLAHARAKKALSPRWLGEVLEEVAPAIVETPAGRIDALLYQSTDAWISTEDVASALGEDFDPITDPNWCMSGDGQSVMRADDYYVGSYREFLARVDRDLAAVTDARVRDKILAQKHAALERLPRIDPKKISYNLHSPYVTDDERIAFLRQFVHPAFYLDEDAGGKAVYKLDVKDSELTDRIKLLRRLGHYIKEGTVTLQGVKVGLSDAEALNYLREQAAIIDAQFELWARSNPAIQARLNSVVNDPANMRFRPANDEAPLAIPGMNQDPPLHPYQNAFVRRMGRDFSGINGHGVGLGKTLAALASVQHVQSLGIKKKTLFVVPASVLSNWHKEAGRAYTSLDACLFVGLRQDHVTGKVKRDAKAVDEDLNDILANQHNKVFMTFEAFYKLRLRDETIEDYMSYMGSVDSAYNTNQSKAGAAERAKSRAAKVVETLADKKGAAPYFEDLGVDSIVIDEAHAMKNAVSVNFFKSAKYLSTPSPSARGLDAMAKSWFVRKDGSDGVVLLTGTPISNSPLEVYSVLALAAGHERINAAFAGIGGADDFMEAVCMKSQELDTGIDGKEKMRDVFIGLSNLEFMQTALHDIAVIEDAQSVGKQVVVPERDEQATSVVLDSVAKALLTQYKLAYRAAKKVLKKEQPEPDEDEALAAVLDKSGEPVELVAHPFNLINKMTMLIADPELDGRATFYRFKPEQRVLAEQAAREIGRRNIKEDREKRSLYTPPDRVTSKVKKVGDEKVQVDVVLVSARVLGEDRIVLDSIDPETQLKFEAYAEKIKLDLDVSVPAKLAALLENFRREAAQPRGLDADGRPSPIVKQIVFCDILPMLSKIKRALVKHAGVSAGKVAIITGKVNGAPEEIIDVQNRFNAHGEENGYNVIIANKKAEVGINLQHGTQAIHHLTIGWTPDSIEQRNGRGARQGNRTVKVAIYHYDAEGTFDAAKRNLVNVKSDWIDSVVKQGSGSVAITGGLSRDEMDALIESSGEGAEAQARVQAGLDAKNRETRIRATRQTQFVSLSTIQTMTKTLAGLTDEARIGSEVGKYVKALRSVSDQRAKVAEQGDKPRETTLKNLAAFEANAKARAQRLDASIKVRDGLEDAGASAVVNRVLGQFPYTSDPQIVKISLKDLAGLNEDGPIAQDLTVERDLAQGMIDASRAKIEELAGMEGAYPADSAAKMQNGEAVLSGTALFSVGDFLTNAGKGKATMLVSSTGIEYPARVVVEGLTFTDADLGRLVLYEDDLLRGVVPVPRGTPEYEEMLDRCAALEDSLQARGMVEQSTMLSAIEPRIAGRRKTSVQVGHKIVESRLPAPYFPYVIAPETIGKSGDLFDLLLELAEAQKAIVKSFKVEPYGETEVFYTEADAGIVDGSGRFDVGFNLALFDQCKARGLKWSYVQTSRYSGVGSDAIAREIVNSLDWSDLVRFIRSQLPADRNAVIDLDAAIAERATAVLDPIMGSYEIGKITRGFPSTLRFGALSEEVASAYNAVTAPAREAEAEAERKAAAERDEAERARVEAERAAREERAKVWVAMSSDYGLTQTVKIRDFSEKMGEPAAWIPKTGVAKAYDAAIAKNRPDAPPNTWVIKRKVYEALLEQYPVACRANHVKIF